jgi:hypothetical protein
MVSPVTYRRAFKVWFVDRWILVSSVAISMACGRRVELETSASSTSAPATEMSIVSAAASVKRPTEETCGDEHSGDVRDPTERVRRDPKTGRTITSVGQPLERNVERSTIATVLGDPSRYIGKPIVLEGDVVAMCSHRRAWYAIVDERGKTPFRIVTLPKFLVPKDAMGKRSRVTGVLEARENSEQMATHLAKDHGVKETRYATILRASGAEFF